MERIRDCEDFNFDTPLNEHGEDVIRVSRFTGCENNLQVTSSRAEGLDSSYENLGQKPLLPRADSGETDHRFKT